jgi:DNA primase catalytic subunit
MRSKRINRSETAEAAFEAELVALRRGIIGFRDLGGINVEERKSLFKVTLNYIDELNKVRKYACPLSTSILLSSIMESLLLTLVLRDPNAAKKASTKIWETADRYMKRKSERINPGIPTFHLAELIEIIDDLGLLRTKGIQSKIIAMRIEDAGLDEHFDFTELLSDSRDAKRNHDLMHSLRNLRNAVHPTLVVASRKNDQADDFVNMTWMGLIVLALLNEMFSIRSPIVAS